MKYILVMDYLDRPLTTRLVFGPHYGRIGNSLESNRAMLQVYLVVVIVV